MDFVDPLPFSPADEHRWSVWEREECCIYYVDTRKEWCTFLELLDLWLIVPYCKDCALADPFILNRDADITPDGWQNDLVRILGEETTKQIIKECRPIQCKRCPRELAAWQDPIYVDSIHPEEYYGIPVDTEGKIWPEKRVRSQIFRLYNHECFNCKKSKQETSLHIDHILPRAKRGDAAFRNLQPLCKKCGDDKADQSPTVVTVISDMYFSPYPPETFEGMFW